MKKINLIIALLAVSGICSSYCIIEGMVNVKASQNVFMDAFFWGVIHHPDNADNTTEGDQKIVDLVDAIHSIMNSATSTISPHNNSPNSDIAIGYDGVQMTANTTGNSSFGLLLNGSSGTAFATETIYTAEEIFSWDILINTQYKYKHGGVVPLNSGGDDYLHLETSIRHELLHGIGFEHNLCNSSLMYWEPQVNMLLGMETDEVDGIECLYGNSPCPENLCCCDNEHNDPDGISPGFDAASISKMTTIDYNIEVDALNSNNVTLNWDVNSEWLNILGFNVFKESSDDNHNMMESVNSELIKYSEFKSNYSLENINKNEKDCFYLEISLKNGQYRMLSLN